MLAELPDARFEVIGGERTPPTRPSCRRAARRWRSPATGTTRSPGFDVLVHTAELEPFGLVAAQALARAVPVIAPRTGGPAEIVRDGVDGLLVDPDDLRAPGVLLIVTLLGDAELRRRMGDAGRAHVTDRFSEERMARDAWHLAERVAAAPPGRRPRG